MKPFIFSADGHVREPADLYSEGLPPSLRQYGIRSEKQGDFLVTKAGSTVIHRLQLNKPRPDEIANFARPNQKGVSDIPARLEDMALEGIDGEIVFPSSGLVAFLVENEEAELGNAELYNNWLQGLIGGYASTFVRCGILPVRNFAYTVQEMKRIAALGFTSAMLPSLIPAGVPEYNDPAWDVVFEAAEQRGIVFVLHTGTGRADVRAAKGPGGAIVNYTVQMCDAQNSCMRMVASGLLDRYPGVHVAFIESGARWLAALAERMDEVNAAHHMFVQPKLSIKPSEIIQRQVHASFQYDRACIMTRSITGTQAIMWGSDYPHHEGTFPHSREVVSKLFDGIEISEAEKADILGGNGVRLFRLHA